MYMTKKSSQMFSIKNTKGFTLIELVIYVAGMVLLLSAVTTLIYSTFVFYKGTVIAPRVDRIGISVVDRITKDIRTGVSYNADLSQFNVPTGALSLNAQTDSTTLTKYFALVSGRLIYQEDSGAIQYLTPDDISVSNFIITPIQTPVSTAMHFQIDIGYTTNDGDKLRSYSGVAILRHSYE